MVPMTECRGSASERPRWPLPIAVLREAGAQDAAFTDGLRNDGDGALALALVGEAVFAWLRAG
jgi:hypothetical protein